MGLCREYILIIVNRKSKVFVIEQHKVTFSDNGSLNQSDDNPSEDKAKSIINAQQNRLRIH